MLLVQGFYKCPIFANHPFGLTKNSNSYVVFNEGESRFLPTFVWAPCGELSEHFVRAVSDRDTSHLQHSEVWSDTTFMTSQKPQKENSMMLALLLFLGAAGLVFAYLSSEEKAPKKTGAPASVKSEKFEKSVNRHLMLTNERIEMARQRMQIENSQALNADFSSTRPQQAYENPNRLDLSQDTRAQEIAEELGRAGRREESMSPHDIVQKELFNADQAQEYSQAYKEEYARQFVENARRGGYKVILSEDLSRVIKVIPIRNPSNSMNLFEDSGSGSGAIQ